MTIYLFSFVVADFALLISNYYVCSSGRHFAVRLFRFYALFDRIPSGRMTVVVLRRLVRLGNRTYICLTATEKSESSMRI